MEPKSRDGRRGKKPIGACLVLLILVICSPIGRAVAANDPHVAIGTPVPQAPLTTSEGVAAEPWADPFCPPSEGTQNTDPGVPPGSWSSLLASALIGGGEEAEVEEVTAQVVAEAWADYLTHSGGVNPPGFSSLEEAKSLASGRAVSALLDQNTWEGIIERVGNVYKPTNANPVEFLAHVDEYPAGVGSAACDGNDGYRLYKASGSNSLWQLTPNGDWAKVIYESGAAEPPTEAIWTHVPDSSHSYIASVQTGNPWDPYGIPMARVVGELTVDGDANLHSCAVDETSAQTVREQLDADVYEAVRGYASWLAIVPQARFLALLPSFNPDCATVPAVYTPWTNGPVVPEGTFAPSPRATYIAGYTASAAGASIDRWERSGTEWLPGEPFAGPTFNNGFDEVEPRLAISGDGQTVAGCWISSPLSGTSGFSLEDTERAGIPARFPEIFHFTDRTVTYPATGTTDPQACSHVSLNQSGDTVWYEQRDLAPHWFSSPTAAANALPTLSLPGAQSAEASGPAGAAVDYVASAHDSSGALAAVCSPPSGSTFALGVTVVSCSATNGAGTVSGSFQVTVRDTTPPTITVPADPLEAEATGPKGAAVSFSATASDAVDGAVPASCSPSSGQTFELGASSVTCTATDQSGNTSERSFNVVVHDTTGPAIAGLPDEIVTPATAPAGAQVIFPQPSADDLVDGATPVSCDPASGTDFPIGHTTVRCTSTDSRGNVTNANFEVTVTPNAIEIPASLTVAARDSTGRHVNYRAQGTDELTGRRVKVSCTPNSGSLFPLGMTTVVCRAGDANGVSTASFEVEVIDTKPPTISRLPEVRRFTTTESAGTDVEFPLPTASDNVDGTVPVTCIPPSGSFFPVGTTTVICTAVDAAGNTATKSFGIVVVYRR